MTRSMLERLAVIETELAAARSDVASMAESISKIERDIVAIRLEVARLASERTTLVGAIRGIAPYLAIALSALAILSK